MKSASILAAGALVGCLTCFYASNVLAAPVELPPPPKLKTPPPQNYWAPGTSLPAFVMQASTGLVECPRTWYEPDACRAYVPGRDRRPRAFVRKEGEWLICPRPTGREGCVGIRKLPNMVEQE